VTALMTNINNKSAQGIDLENIEIERVV